MTEFEHQLTARLQAMDFLLQAVIRQILFDMSPDAAAQTIAKLETQFSTLTMPMEADRGADLDEVASIHRDAQHFLSRFLKQADPHDRA